jgi:tetratricopeptide (TPR) repeat protein
LLRHSGGSPLFLLETLKTWLSQGAAVDLATRLPPVPGVATLIERRIGQLSVAALRLLRCAAVAAPDFSIELASRVLGERAIDLADPWAELEHAQLLRDGAFAHDLILDSTRASVPAPVARQLHAEIAAYLQERGAEPARVAHHWLDAGRDPEALAALREAAERARLALRKRDEIALRERALPIAERLAQPDAAFELALSNFEAQMVVDRTCIDDAVFQRLDRLAVVPGQQLRLLLAQADYLMSTGQLAQAAPRAEQAAALARAQGDTVREIEGLRCAAACASYGGDSQRAVDLLQPALPRVLEHLAEHSDRAAYFADLASCLDNADQPLQASGFHRRALDEVVAVNRWDLAAVICANLSHNLKSTGRVQQAFDHAQQARRHALAVDAARGATYNLDTMELALLRDLASDGSRPRRARAGPFAGPGVAAARAPAAGAAATRRMGRLRAGAGRGTLDGPHPDEGPGGAGPCAHVAAGRGACPLRADRAAVLGAALRWRRAERARARGRLRAGGRRA